MQRFATTCDYVLKLRRMNPVCNPWRVLVCIAATLSAIGQTGSDRYPIVKNQKVGFIDQRGDEVIAPAFFSIADMAHFSEGLAPVATPEGAGYIDASGRFAIGPTKEWGQPRVFHEGIAGVLIWRTDGTTNTPAFIDRNGRVIFSSNDVDERTYFSEGLMPMSNHQGRWGFVDRNFRWIIDPKYDWAGEFSEGLAQIKSGSKCGYIDKSGHEIIPPRYDMNWAFSDGLARVRIDIRTGEMAMTMEGRQPVRRELYGFIDRNGGEIIRLQFSWATDFQEGHALIKPAGSALESVIDKQGVLLHEPRFESAMEFCEGLAAVRSGGKWGYINHDGSWAIEPRFSNADSFWHGLARVAWENHRGYIERTGRVVWMLVTK
jgi:hypothetical protein